MMWKEVHVVRGALLSENEWPVTICYIALTNIHIFPFIQFVLQTDGDDLQQ